MNSDNNVIIQQSILDMLRDGVFCLNNKGNLSFMNREAERLLQVKKEEIIGKNILKINKDAKRIFLKYRNAFVHQTYFEFEEYYPPLHCWFKIKAYEVQDYYVIQFQDITMNKKLIQETLYYHNSLFDYHPDIVFLMSLEGTILAVNQKFVELTGYSSDEMIMNSFFMICHDEEAIQSVEKASLGERLNVEVRIQNKDNKMLDVDLLLNPVIANQEIIGIYGIAKDISEAKFSKTEIARLNDLNELILNSVAEGIYGIDLKGNIIFWNQSAQRMTGFVKEEFRTYSLHSGINQTGYPLASCNYEIQVVEDTFWRKDGSTFPVEYTATPICEQGKIVGTVITFRDISERKRTEDMLRQSEKLSAVGQLAAGIAHEIRNPLTSLKGFLQLMRVNNSHKEVYYEIMDSEFNRIETILSELLMVAKPQASTFTVCSINQIIHEVTTLLEAQAVLKGVQIVSEAEETIFVYCNSSQLKQVFINLIKNAIEAMDKGGIISTNVKKQQEYGIIRICDQGKGIPKEKLDQLGRPFYSTKEKGTGLGLMVTYQIIENHQGKMEVQSEKDIGTCFTITLPIGREIISDK